jgi:hypothetical protein
MADCRWLAVHVYDADTLHTHDGDALRNARRNSSYSNCVASHRHFRMCAAVQQDSPDRLTRYATMLGTERRVNFLYSRAVHGKPLVS